jgi:nucleotidyltransferase/DNA polymerase involved in DNA repair
MDYFFAACEELRHPELKGKPLIVGTHQAELKMRGVVQTCNYEARAFGIRSAMPTQEAFKLKPDIAYLPSDETYYEQISDRVQKLLLQYGIKMEKISVDEFAIDSGLEDYGSAQLLAEKMKENIGKSIGLPCTIGVSVGKTFAKMACDQAKPNGLMVLKEEELESFLKDKEVTKLIGIGNKTKVRLNAMGIKTIGDIKKANASKLVAEFGAVGAYMYSLANGRETEKIEDPADALSIGRERTLEHNSEDREELLGEIAKLSKVVVGELKGKGMVFKTVSIKAKYSDFSERIKSKTLQHYSDSQEPIDISARSLIDLLMIGKPIRKIGVRVSTLINAAGQKKLT